MSERCATCRFYRCTYPHMIEGVGEVHGSCRRHPPPWGIVCGGDWCGEYEPMMPVTASETPAGDER